MVAALLVAATSIARAQSITNQRLAGRVLGVFDAVSGAPIAGAEVTDLLTGTTALTTTTGTVSLAFVDTSGSLIRIRKIGYDAKVFMVANSARDTVPLTIVLQPSAPRLPTVVTHGYGNLRGPADTVRKLETHGYYDRRMFSGAPSTAFVTGERLDRLYTLSDVVYLTGRCICTSNLYVDGIRVSSSPGSIPKSRNVHSPVADQQPKVNQLASLPIQNVLAVELYTHVAEFPAEYNRTQDVSRGCLTLVWTK